MRTVTARYVFPVSGPPLVGGLLTFDGDRIVAVEPAGTRTPDEDFGNAAILPGLVNAHTHLDLSGARGLIPPTDPDHFTDWLKGVIAYRRTRTPEHVQNDIRACLNEVLQSGTTLVGDITSGGESIYSNMSRQAASIFVNFREVIGLSSQRASMAWQGVNQRIRCGYSGADDRNGVPTRDIGESGLSPHAPYSVNKNLFRRVASQCRHRSFPVAIHLAETPGELELIERREGPFVPFLEGLGAWYPDGLIANINELLRIFDGVSPLLWIHCNYLLPDTLLPHGSTVVYCPRTHAAFGHPPHPFREFLARGVRVCLGTDSLASNPDLDILAEARFMRSRYPDFPGDQLLKMIALSGAEALGWADECGSLEVGKSADFVVVPLPTRDGPDPHDLFLKDDSAPATRRTMFRGEWRE